MAISRPGPYIAPIAFTDRAVVLRQAFCPSCLVLPSTAIVRGSDTGYRSWSVGS